MLCKIGNKVIDASVEKILHEAKNDLTNGKLKHIYPRGRNLIITCPSHKDGKESKPSCNVLAVDDDPKVEYGTAHCFACGYSAKLPQLIADLFDESYQFGEDWLLDRFCNVFIERDILLPSFDLEPTVIEKNEILDESILTDYDFYHPYMWKRGLSKEVVDEFRVGYDKIRDAITFPVYDERHRLVMITARCVSTKFFFIPGEVEKPVYLLYDVLEKNQDTVFVCESQINALYLRSLFNVSAVALFGTGSHTQLETLKKSGIRNYILCFDGDTAGRKGAIRFQNALSNQAMITEIKFPQGKDANNYSKEELIQIFNSHGVSVS